jgi:hypothetical protein
MRLRILTVAMLTVLATVVSGATPAAASGSFSLFATGLNNPRGLTFGENGVLYVAEGGTGGSQTTTAAQCTQVLLPIGPYSGGMTGRISKVSRTGVVTTVAANLPSNQTNPLSGGLVSGVADVAFIGDTLYALTAAAGCSHGLAGTVNSILRVNRNGSTSQVANLSSFLMTHPVAAPNAPDFEPDGTWYSMVAVHDKLFAVEPNHGEVDVIKPNGRVSRLVDVSASQGHIVPTAITYYRGNFYIANLNTFDPGAFGHSKVFKLTQSGHLSVVADSLTAVTGVAFHDGHLYALQAFAATTPLTPFTGSVVRLNDSGGWDTVAGGLAFPTAMTFGPDGNLYVSNFGFGFPPGAGQVVKILVSREGDDNDN